MRRLYIFPIIHTDVELGSLAPEFKKSFIRERGLGEWKRHQAAIKEFWDRIVGRLAGLKLDYRNVYIYQDGFPTGMASDKMVKEMINEGSRNYMLIDSLIKRGARLIGTEKPSLLRKEYKHFNNEFTTHKISTSPENLGRHASELLNQRDSFIAQQIDKTLPEKRTGILFTGAKHNVAVFLPTNIQVTTVIT